MKIRFILTAISMLVLIHALNAQSVVSDEITAHELKHHANDHRQRICRTFLDPQNPQEDQ